MLICYIITIYTGCIVLYFIFGNSVFDFYTIFILWKICKTIVPVTIRIRSYFYCLNTCSISKQVNRNKFRSCSILIIIIIPSLTSTYFRCLRRMGIDYIIAIITCIIALYFIFGNEVFNFSTVLIFRKIVKLPLPSICCCHSLICNFLLTLPETNDNTFYFFP